VDGLGGPVGGLGGPVHGFSHFFVFYLINRGGQLNRLGKDFIYRDLFAETVAMPGSVNRFYPPQLRFV
jgi:hypothetical protein